LTRYISSTRAVGIEISGPSRKSLSTKIPHDRELKKATSNLEAKVEHGIKSTVDKTKEVLEDVPHKIKEHSKEDPEISPLAWIVGGFVAIAAVFGGKKLMERQNKHDSLSPNTPHGNLRRYPGPRN
jgi:hypothetical protein